MSTYIALEGMQPTFKHVPPRAPRFSIQAVCLSVSMLVRYPIFGAAAIIDVVISALSSALLVHPHPSGNLEAHLEPKLGSLNSRHIATRSTADNDDIVRIASSGETASTV